MVLRQHGKPVSADLVGGVSVGGNIVSGILVVLEFCAPEKRPTYTGLTNTSTGLVSSLAPLIGAWLAAYGYNWLFALGATFSLLAYVVFHWRVQEPRRASLLRTMT